MITCFIEGEAVGNCVLFIMNKLKVRHRARIAIAVLQKVWNKGIGTLFFEEIFRIAKDKQLMQLELEYIEGNERAKHLYEKMGFVQFAERPNSIRVKDGTLLSEYLMIKQL
ncbi:MAG TPA: GNAT family N-acetyltransferase [Clostridiaceae bacterium]|nr:GNAT family N-acetyltransferase [Clostridiaceae bacterium]